MLQPGENFAGYVIERELGRGGMGAVYLARHPRLPRWIALKVLSSEYHGDSETHARFEREADLAARLNHPCVVTVYDRGVEHGRLWIAMQYVDGVEAEAVPDITPAQAVEIVAATADALDYAHRVGVLHRDVKPANILLARETREQQAGVLLTDFGIARLQGDTGRLTGSGSVMATLAYASPEQLQNHPIGPYSDQYSLACTLFRLLTGIPLFPSTDLGAIVKSHLYDNPPPVASYRTGLPSALDSVLARALAKRPEDRYPSCTDFAVAARRALGAAGEAVIAPPPARAKSPETPVRRANSATAGRRADSGATPVRPSPQDARAAGAAQRRDQQSAALRSGRVPPAALRSGRVSPAALRSGQVPAAALRSGRVPVGPEGPRPRTGSFPKAGAAAAKPSKRTGLRAMLLVGVCLAAALGLGIFLVTPFGNSAKPKPPASEIGDLSAAFPGLVPRTPELGSGFAGASCRVADHDSKDFLPPWAFEGWLAAWDCVYSATNHDVKEYVLFAYSSSAAAQSVAKRIHPAGSTIENLAFKEYCGSKEYTNFRFDSFPDVPSTSFATTFFDDPKRDKFLMYTRGTPATPSGVVDWWKSLPLTQS
ncbi:hypothetical protein JMUB6875_32190 [Nocardia sp. JMUB6875]|uniref:serine/threonine-protein kinase n=1 Tax=Nocardia sp. JMUB6875 TaxID=3158170 RepID=UPI0032E715A7